MRVIQKDSWQIWTPIGSWWYGTDFLSEQKMRSKYAELLAKYPKMGIEKRFYKQGEKTW